MNRFDEFDRAGKRPRFFSPPSQGLETQLVELLGPLDPQQMARLLPIAQKSVDLAVNAFFDEKSVVKKEESPSNLAVLEETAAEPRNSDENERPESKPVVWPRNLGNFQASLWVTRSGRSPKFGDKLFFKRVPPKSAKHDVVVRVLLQDEFGPELARVAEQDAKFVAPLMDHGLAQFSGSVVFCDLPLRTGDTVYAQIDVAMSLSAFTEPIVDEKMEQKRAKDLDETKENSSEQAMSLRQQALNRLFGRLGVIEQDHTEKSNSELNQVTKQQLDMVYQNSVKAELDEREPAPTFALQLYPYQRKALYWMSQRESDLENSDDTLHPLWTELKWPSGDSFYANLSSGELSIKKPTMVTAGMGGILADEMGLGKTIQILALVHTSRPKRGPTLIVAPMSLLTQWQQEAQKSAKRPEFVDAQVYYGAGMDQKLKQCVAYANKRAAIVITSYGVMASEYKNYLQDPSKSAFFSTHFDRVVLDEAHIIKNKNTIAARAASSISATKRWAVTGTPVINRLEDLYSLIKYLGVQPWNNFSFWSAFITKPFDSGDAEQALKTVQSIVDPICLRRTKDMKHNGKPLVELPEKVIEIKRLKFTTAESDLYSFMFSRIRTSVQDSMKEGTATKRMASLLYQILRLRQICCHPLLIRRQKQLPDGEDDAEAAEATEAVEAPELTALLDHFHHVSKPKAHSLDSYAASVVSQVVETAEQAECSICFEPVGVTKQALTPCYHMACIDCILEYIEHTEKKGTELSCPMCRKLMNRHDLLIVDKINDKIVLREYVEDHQSTKIRSLIEELRTPNAGTGKTVVFSQFTSFLDLIAPELEYFGFEVLKVDGRLSMHERDQRLEGFKSTDKPVVLLLSLKVGGVGLNLTCANQVFMMDPWWNFATESQAIDRIHRMGQTSTTRVVRFIVEGSIEERMLKIQERKDALSAVVGTDEKKSNTLEDIKLLFDLDGRERG